MNVFSGTVFMIWIVVPIMITTLTAFYIVLNGNNRFGRAVRGCFMACCQRTMPARTAEQTAEEDTNQSPEEGGPARNETREHLSGRVYAEDNIAPVESVEMDEVRPGPSNASSGPYW